MIKEKITSYKSDYVIISRIDVRMEKLDSSIFIHLCAWLHMAIRRLVIYEHVVKIKMSPNWSNKIECVFTKCGKMRQNAPIILRTMLWLK